MNQREYNILYIDDEENNLIVFKNSFFRHYKIFTALSGGAGLKIMEENDIHLIITDQKMPGMTGIEVLEKVVEKHPQTIRMILTAYSDIEIIMRAINKCGIYQYILKPWDSGELQLVIDNALKSYELAKRNKVLLNDLKKANQELEKKVIERTKELNIKNEELTQLNAVKDKLFSIISHDLKTPIASLSILMEVLKTNIPLDEIENYSLKVQSYIRDVTDLLDNLLQWSLTQIGDKKVNPAELDIKSVIQKNLDLSRIPAQQKEIQLKTKFPEEEVLVIADQEMLNLILRNLLSNAIKYSNPKGEVQVSVDFEGDNAVINVKDKGIGISSEAQSKLFKLEQHTTTRGTAEEKGAGLGLKLCKEFLEIQGGKIKVKSEPGKGSEFRFALPMVKVKVKV